MYSLPCKFKQIIVHIGLEKTGTTSIQNFLNDNVSFLKAENIIYPKYDRNRHDLLSYYFSDQSINSDIPRPKLISSFGEYMKNLADTLSYDLENSTLIFSDELISSRLTRTQCKRLVTELKKYAETVFVISVFREPRAYIWSLYAEAVKAGETRNFCNWCDEFDYIDLNWSQHIKNWESLVGEKYKYTSFEHHPNSIEAFQNLLLRCGLVSEHLRNNKVNKRLNVSLSSIGIYLLRYLNHIPILFVRRVARKLLTFIPGKRLPPSFEEQECLNFLVNKFK